MLHKWHPSCNLIIKIIGVNKIRVQIKAGKCEKKTKFENPGEYKVKKTYKHVLNRKPKTGKINYQVTKML